MNTVLRQARRLRPGLVWVVLAVLVLAVPPRAGAEDNQDSVGNYGNAPKRILPYHGFQEPYKYHFREQIPFRGTGRDHNLKSLPRTVRLGLFAPFGEAPDADIGECMIKGAQLAIEQANAEGGYQGIPFELVFRGDLGLWGASSNEMVGFKYEDSVMAVFGSVDGANTHIALRVILKLEMPMMTTTTDPTVTETNIPWLMRCMADDRQQGYALAAHVFGECGIKHVVAFRVSDRYGRLGIMEFRGAATRLGYPLRGELQWTRGDRDFTEELDRVAKLKPEAVVLWGPATDAAAIVKAIRERQLPIRVFGSERLASRAFLEAAGEAAEGVVAAATWDPTRDDPKLAEFVEAFTERFGCAPETHAAHVFDGFNILIKCVREAGLNRPRIRDAMYNCTHYEGVTGSIVLDPSLNDVGPVYLASVKNREFVYREADLASYTDNSTTEPYRTLAQSPPTVRSPNDDTAGPGEAFRIGCFLPLDDHGQHVVRGMQAAIEDDRRINPQAVAIALEIQDSRGAWGRGTDDLVNMVFTDRIVALVGSTERHGTHLAEVLASKFHFPVLSLCGSDPTITQIPLPWVFCVAGDDGIDDTPASAHPGPGTNNDRYFALGYDAAAILIGHIREGNNTRKELREAMAATLWYDGLTGTFRFDALGNRVDADNTSGRISNALPSRKVKGLIR